MELKMNLFEFCNNIGDFSSFMLRNHLADVREIKHINDSEKLKSIDFERFKQIWREKIGPRFYYDSIVSSERQLEILDYLGIAFPIYVERKKKIIEENRKTPPDLTKPAWFSINTSDTEKGYRLQMGFTNYGCDYWRNGTHHVGCYNCGFFIGVDAAEKPNKEDLIKNIEKQFDYAVEHVNGKGHDYDAIDFVGDGSFLNENEIPFEAQKKLFKKISEIPDIKRVLVEARPEYVEHEKIQILLGHLREDQNIEIAIGLETVDKFVATFCINKGFLLQMDEGLKKQLKRKDIYDAIDAVKDFKKRVSIQFYALVKPALLSEIESLNDSVNTGRYINKLSRKTGISINVKFEPTVIPKGTLLEVLNDIYINKKREIVIPGREPERVIDLFDPKEQEENNWEPLHTPPSYWTIAELISRLAIDDSHKIARFGGREDMHVSKSIPAVYDSRFGSVGMLNKIDFRLYYAVQRFNAHKDITRFLEDIKHCLENESFKRWKDEAVKLIFSQILRDVEDLKADITINLEEEFFLKNLEELIDYLEYSQTSQEFFKTLSERYKTPKDKKSGIQDFIFARLKESCDFIQKKHIDIGSLQVIANEYDNLKKPGLTRLEINVFNPRTGKNYDAWTFIPEQHIDKSIYQKTKRTEIERKFIVETIPPGLPIANPTNITQGYIAITKDSEVRIRKKTKAGKSKYVSTWKSKGDKTREEIEVDIDEHAFNNLVYATEGKLVEKERYKLPFCFIDNNKAISFDVKKYPGNKLFEIELDIFKGHLYGLMVAEIEFGTETESQLLTDETIPEWFGKEVTFDKRFKNQNLSKDKFDAILIQTSKRYANDCLCFSNNQRFIESAEPIVEQKGMNFRRFHEQIETLGEINADVVEILRSSNVALVDNDCLDVNLLTKLAVRETTTSRTILTATERLEHLAVEMERALKLPKNEPVISTFEDISLSKIIERQQIIDNEILSVYEKESKEVWVITSTMEFDVGDLQEAVEHNLANGKKYVYFVPNEGSKAFYSEIFSRNKRQFEKLFKDYLGTWQIDIREFPKNFDYYFKEIIIYDALSAAPFGFTYIVNNRNNDFELIEIKTEYLKEIIEHIKNTFYSR